MKYVNVTMPKLVFDFDSDEKAIEFYKKNNENATCVIVNINTKQRIDVYCKPRYEWLADDNYNNFMKKYMFGNFCLSLVSNFIMTKDTDKIFLVTFRYDGKDYSAHTRNADAYYTIFGKYADYRSNSYEIAKRDVLLEVAKTRDLI